MIKKNKHSDGMVGKKLKLVLEGYFYCIVKESLSTKNREGQGAGLSKYCLRVINSLTSNCDICPLTVHKNKEMTGEVLVTVE